MYKTVFKGMQGISGFTIVAGFFFALGTVGVSDCVGMDPWQLSIRLLIGAGLMAVGYVGFMFSTVQAGRSRSCHDCRFYHRCIERDRGVCSSFVRRRWCHK